jgi:hypothetical protein
MKAKRTAKPRGEREASDGRSDPDRRGDVRVVLTGDGGMVHVDVRVRDGTDRALMNRIGDGIHAAIGDVLNREVPADGIATEPGYLCPSCAHWPLAVPRPKITH